MRKQSSGEFGSHDFLSRKGSWGKAGKDRTQKASPAGDILAQASGQSVHIFAKDRKLLLGTLRE
jgi:hypothetical protein